MILKVVVEAEEGRDEEQSKGGGDDKDVPVVGDDLGSVEVFVVVFPRVCCRCCCDDDVSNASKAIVKGASDVTNLCPNTVLTVSCNVVLESLVATATSSRCEPFGSGTISIN